MTEMLRRFNSQGLNAFKIFLEDLRDGVINSLPTDFMISPKYSVVITPEIEIDSSEFSTKFAMAETLNFLLKDHNIYKNIWSDVGLWSWISAYLFDYVCPLVEGIRKPGENYRHILEVAKIGGGWSRFYRHLIACPVRLYDFLDDNSKILLTSEFNKGGDFIEQFASRREIISNRTAMNVLNKLYYDEKMQGAKRGAQTRTRPGNHRRYLMILDQLSLNYDTYSMTPNDLMSKLPDEFDGWINDKN